MSSFLVNDSNFLINLPLLNHEFEQSPASLSRSSVYKLLLVFSSLTGELLDLSVLLSFNEVGVKKSLILRFI